ncbi:hypothetical protein [Oscillatoria salina]|uniref:hypothetical protein n=1 Tax=Oscillatoria salina TaxID=331517 RepID=UPI0013BE387C|nr:hypothetical protein [Oscillatoria salina]MBZ8180720.1 hypothetical protein [Oscillatoria salina IIICB1]NET87587.1 hypothetical protein [Kamptonema sp. SIO1D9]
MSDRPEQQLAHEFRHERTIRRTAVLLDRKRKRIREDIQQLIAHMAFLVPTIEISQSGSETQADLLQEALLRLGDDAFAQMVVQIMQELK